MTQTCEGRPRDAALGRVKNISTSWPPRTDCNSKECHLFAPLDRETRIRQDVPFFFSTVLHFRKYFHGFLKGRRDRFQRVLKKKNATASFSTTYETQGENRPIAALWKESIRRFETRYRNSEKPLKNRKLSGPKFAFLISPWSRECSSQ